MASDDHAPGFVPGQGFTQEDWDEVSDNPETTDEEQAQARPMAEALPELVAAMRRKRGTPKVATKDLVSLRLDKDVLATLRAGGSGWQSRANGMLRKGLGLDIQPSKEEDADLLWLEGMRKALLRIYAGENVAPDEVRQMAEVVQQHMEAARVDGGSRVNLPGQG